MKRETAVSVANVQKYFTNPSLSEQFSNYKIKFWILSVVITSVEAKY